MAEIERIELERYRAQLTADVKNLVEKYRAIFDWDIPEIDENMADRLIIAAVREALAGVEKELLG
ncbi:MAG TPA: hypothetical protein VMV75_06040 [Sulfuricella sp.]|nr:hypothetical protein [Sulfuricella sp.]